MTRKLAVRRKHCPQTRQRQRRPWIAVIGAVWVVAVSLAPPAPADPIASLRVGVASLRNVTSCGPLRYNAVVTQAAESIARSTSDYLNHNATAQPIADAVPELRRLGYGGNKGHILQGHGEAETDAVKYVLLEGAAAKPDCYTDFGVAVLTNASIGQVLASAVLAGP